MSAHSKGKILNLQTEHIENHRARFTIEIESNQLEEAKRQAARKISRQVRIKGFRKGKAPYRLVAQYVGEAAILEEALEALGDTLYKGALEESNLDPYGPGVFEDFKAEPAPTFVFTMPLQPEVDLNDYQDIRIDFDEPSLNDDDIDDALKQMRMRALEVTDENVKIAEAGHRVRLRVESEFVDGDELDAAAEEAEDAVDAAHSEPAEDATTDEKTDGDADAAPYTPKKGETFVHDENAVIILDPNEDPFTHGFVDNVIGAELGSDVEFELTIPDDDADETIRNRRVSFIVTINGIEAINIPELDDDFARPTQQGPRRRGDGSRSPARSHTCGPFAGGAGDR